jgi:hypothetical protein
MFVGKARSLPKMEDLIGASLGYTPALPSNIRLGFKRFARDKQLRYSAPILKKTFYVSVAALG